MSLTVINLNDILSVKSIEETQSLLRSFTTNNDYITGDINDVEDFLHNKAIDFKNWD